MSGVIFTFHDEPSDDDTADIMEVARFGGDLDWWDAVEACGGCGEDACHPGKPCTGDLCQLCPNRNRQLRAEQ